MIITLQIIYDNRKIIGHRNYRSYDEVMIKLPYDEFVMIYDHNNIFRKFGQ